MRRQPGARARLGPQQPLGERRQMRALALDPDHQRRAERHLPLLQRAPGVAVRAARRARRRADRAGVAQRAQQIDERVGERRAALLGVGGETVLEVDAAARCGFVHGSTIHRQCAMYG